MRNFQLNCSKFSSKAVSSHTGFRHRNFHARSAYFCGGVGCKPGTVCVFAIHIHIPMKHLLYGIRYDKAYKVGYFEDLVGYPKQYSFSLTHIFPTPFPNCDVTNFPPLTSNRWCQIHFPVSVYCALTVSESPEVAHWPFLSPAGFPAF